MLGAAHDGDLLLAAWPGEWSQDVFVVDDLPGARLAVGLPRKGQKPPAENVESAGSVSWDPSSFVPSGRLWCHLAEIPALPVEGRRQLTSRFADHYASDEDAIALLRRTDLDPSVRRALLNGVTWFRAAPLIADEGCTPEEALALLDRFRTAGSVIEAALRRRETREAAYEVLAALPYLDAAKVWMDGRISRDPMQFPDLADRVLRVILTKEPPESSSGPGYGADRYDRPSMVRLLLKEVPEERRREYLRHPEYGSLAQQALLTEDQLTDNDLLLCLPEILMPGPVTTGAAPTLLLHVYRFPRLAELGGTDLRQAATCLLDAGWSPVQAARSGHWDALLAAARLAETPNLIEALAQAAVFDRATPRSESNAAERWTDPRRYELVDLLVSKTGISEKELCYLLDRLPLDHVQDLQESARKRGRLHRLCTQMLEARMKAPFLSSAGIAPLTALPTDDELSTAADPQAVLRNLMSYRGRDRNKVIDHALASAHMTDELAWRLPVQDLERHPVYGPRLAAEVVKICGDSPARWQAFARAWTQPTSLLATLLFSRLHAAEQPAAGRQPGHQ